MGKNPSGPGFFRFCAQRVGLLNNKHLYPLTIKLLSILSTTLTLQHDQQITIPQGQLRPPVCLSGNEHIAGSLTVSLCTSPSISSSSSVHRERKSWLAAAAAAANFTVSRRSASTTIVCSQACILFSGPV